MSQQILKHHSKNKDNPHFKPSTGIVSFRREQEKLEKLSNDELLNYVIANNRDPVLVNVAVTRNLGLLSYVLDNILPNLKKMPHLREDLLQEGYFGLVEAVKRYDNTRNTRFSTYASWWIMQAYTDYASKHTSTIRLPAYLRTKLRKLRVETQENGNDMYQTAFDSSSNRKNDAVLRGLTAQTTLSCDSPLGSHLIKKITSETLSDEKLFGCEVKKVLSDAIMSLPKEERVIVLMRYGYAEPATKVSAKKSSNNKKVSIK